MLGRALLTAVAISYLICVLILSGVQKEDLDVGLLQKLQRHNVNIKELNDEKLQQECLTKIKPDVKNEIIRNEANVTQAKKNSTQLLLIKNEKEKTEENLSRRLEPGYLEAILKYIKNKNVKIPGKVEENLRADDSVTTPKENKSFTKENIDNMENNLSTKTTGKSADFDVKNREVATMLKYLTDVVNNKLRDEENTKNKQDQYKKQYNKNNLRTFSNNALNNEKIESYDILEISKILSENVGMKKTVQNTANTVLQALNQILRNNQINGKVKGTVIKDDSKLEQLMITPQVEYLPYVLESQEITTETTMESDKQVTLLNLYGRNIEENKNYPLLRNFTEIVLDPGLGYKYNYYLQNGPVQPTMTPKGNVPEINTQAKTSVIDTNKDGKDIKLSLAVIRQIAESVKDIVLKDLKKQLSTNVIPSTTTPSTIKCTTAASVTEQVTTAPSLTTNSALTVKNESSSTPQVNISDAVQQTNQMSKAMTKILAILNEMKKVKDGNLHLNHSARVRNENIANSRIHSDMTTSRVIIRTYVHNNNQQRLFSPLFVDTKAHPELMPPPIIQGQHPDQEKSIIPLQQRTPNERSMAPLLIQTNSDQIPPLSIPLMKPGSINLNILLTTESPYKRPYLSQDKWNREQEFHKPQQANNRRKEKNKERRNYPEKLKSRDNYTESNNSTGCLNSDKGRTLLLNKTDEIMAKLKNIETLFYIFKSKNVSIADETTAVHKDSSSVIVDQNLLSNMNSINESIQEDTTETHKDNSSAIVKRKDINIRNYTNNTEQSEDIKKKIRDLEIGLATLRDMSNHKTMDHNLSNNFEKPQINYSIKYDKSKHEEILKYRDVIAKVKGVALRKASLIKPKPKIRNTQKLSVYTKKREEIDIRLKNIEKDIQNLRQQIGAAPKGIEQQLSNNFHRRRGAIDRSKITESKAIYSTPKYKVLEQVTRKRNRARIYPKLPQIYKVSESELYEPKQNKDILTKLKNMQMQSYKSKQDDYRQYVAEPLSQFVPKKLHEGLSEFLPTEKQSYESKQGMSFNTGAKLSSYRAESANDEGFNPYKDLMNVQTTKRRNSKHYVLKDFEDYPMEKEEIKGFHEKLETTADMPIIKTPSKDPDDNFMVTLESRQLLPIQDTKPKYDDSNFKTFLKTQEKVNNMIERILATKAEPELELGPTDM